MRAENPEANQSKRLAPLLLVLVLCVSAFIQFSVATRSEFVNPLAADSGRYFSYAYNVEHFGIYSSQISWDPSHAEGPLAPDKARAPGYPAFLMLFAPAEPTMRWVRKVFIWQALLGVLTVLLSFSLAREVFSAPWALVAAGLTALSPHLAAITAEVLTESIFTFSLVAATWVSARSFRLGNVPLAVAAGLLWGAASLIRPTAQLLPPLMLAATVAMPALRPSRHLALMGLLAFAAIQTPWWVRNLATDSRPGEENLTVGFIHHGSYPDLMYSGRSDTEGFPYRFDPDSPRISKSLGSALAHVADNFRQQPLQTARWYLLGKPIRFLSWRIVGGWGDIFTAEPTRSPYLEDRRFSAIHAFMRATHGPLMLLGVLGGLLAFWNPRWLCLLPGELAAARILALVLAYGIALHMVGAPFPRYSIPFRPLSYTLALIPMFGCWRLLRARQALPPAGPR